MPIHCPIALAPVSDTDFDRIDGLVMAASYASHNRLGRLCDERVYENDVAARLRANGMPNVHTQVPVTVAYHTFLKTYRLDLVVDQVIYELKSVAALASEHEAQAIHYAAMCDTDRVKLINFGASKVAGSLRRTPFAELDRRATTIVQDMWQPLSSQCELLAATVTALLADWGAFLEAGLYEEALVHLVCGASRGESRLPVTRDGIELGTHRQPCHTDDIGFLLTALTRDATAYGQHLQRLLNTLPLRAFQWFNLKHTELQMVTLTKEA